MTQSKLFKLEQDIQWNTVLYLIENKKSFNLVIAVDERFKNDLSFLEIGNKQGILTLPMNTRFYKNIELLDILGETQIKVKMSITIDNTNFNNTIYEDSDNFEDLEDKIITLKLRKYDIISVVLVDGETTKVISNLTHYPTRPIEKKKSLIQQLIDESDES